MATIPERFNRFFEHFWPTRWDDEQLTAAGWRPRVDVYDQDGTAVIQAELPGVKKEDIDIDVRGNILTLKGKRETESEVDENNYYFKERSYGAFQRSFTLPEAIDPKTVDANFSDGVLKVKIPKPKESGTQKIQIS
jgi:HSP20 family protein